MMLQLLAFLLLFSTALTAQQTTVAPSYFPLKQVLVGESALLNIQTLNERPADSLVSAEKSSLKFQFIEPDVLGGRIVSSNIAVSSSVAGSFTVPAFQVPLKGSTLTSSPFEMEVFPVSTITWQTLTIGSNSYRVGTALFHPSGTIYAGQSIPLTAKILFPTNLPLRSQGFAELEKDNIGAWRLEPPFPPNYDQQVSPRNPHAMQPREMIIEGKRYKVINYTTFAAPLKAGPVTLGPGTVKSLQVQVTTQTERSRGFFGSFSRSYNIELELPEVTFMAQALPKGAPAGFQGAIGDFSLQASLDISKELQSGDPVMVELTVAGQGNLDILKAPVLDAPESNWKIYPSSRVEKEGDRRSNEGAVSFTQILRPLVPIKAVPSFTLAYFNPKTTSYETLRSQPIPLNLSPLQASATSGAPKAGLVPIAEMQDILAVIPPRPFNASKSLRIGYWWQIVPALIVGALLALLIKRQLPRLKKQDTDADEKRAAFKTVESEKEPAKFLRAAANFAEQNGFPEDDFLQELRDERDQRCFQPGQSAPEFPKSRRSEILAGLRERLSLWLLLLTVLALFHPTSAHAFHSEGQASWDKGEYQEALDTYQLALKVQKTPDLLYNIANCYYRLNQPGQAALFYHRALERDPKHPEARQNLAFLDRKMGIISPPDREIPIWAKRLSLPLITGILLALAWIAVIALLVRFVRPTAYVKRYSTITLIASSSLFLAFLLTRFFHPGPGEPTIASDAVLVAKEATEIRTEPSSGGSVILNANPATTCHILATRGDWAYIELPNAVRGWIPEKALEKI